MFRTTLAILFIVIPAISLATHKVSLNSFLVEVDDMRESSGKRIVYMNFVNRPDSYEQLAQNYGIAGNDRNARTFMPFYFPGSAATYLGSKETFELPVELRVDARTPIIPTTDEKYLIIDVYGTNRIGLKSKGYAKLFNLQTWQFEDGLIELPNGFDLVDVIDRPDNKRYLAIGKSKKHVQKQVVHRAAPQVRYEGVGVNVLSRVFAAGGGGGYGNSTMYVTSFHKKATHISSETGLAKIVWVNYFESLWNSLRPEGSVKSCNQILSN